MTNGPDETGCECAGSGSDRGQSQSPARAEVVGPHRLAMIVLGCSCVAIGAIGAFLPLLPTTPFLLIALWAFSRSSARLHRWLYTHKILGPSLRNWREHRIIPVRAKVSALLVMAASFVYLLLGHDAPWQVLVVAATVMLGAASFILSCPSGRQPT